MSWTVDTFKAAMPEFEPTDDYVVEDALVEATRRTNSTVYNTKLDDARKWLTAHLIAIRPGAEQARLSKEIDITIYYKEFERVRNEMAFGFRVI